MALSTFAGGRLWGARYGTAAPWVLALHGWRRDHHDWDEVLDGLDAVALDLPGHGVAPEPPEPWSTRQYAEWVAPALRDLAGGPVVIAGHSFGARVAVQLAAALGEDGQEGADGGESIGALVLVAAPLAPIPGGGSVRPSFVYRAGRALNRVGFVPEKRMEQLRQKHGSDDYRQASPVMRGVLVKAASETASAAYVPSLRAWASVGGPVELVWGERDEQASFAGVISLPRRYRVRHPHRRARSRASHEGRPGHCGPGRALASPTAAMNSRILEATALAVGASALVPAYLRWLRVGQREHYLPGSASRFALRWWGAGNVNRLLVAVGLSGAVASIGYAPAAFASAAGSSGWPIGPVRAGTDLDAGMDEPVAPPLRRHFRPGGVADSGDQRRRAPPGAHCGCDLCHGSPGGRRPGALAHEEARVQVVAALRRPSDRASAGGRSTRRRHYGFVRQNDYEGLRCPLGGREPVCRCEPCQLQQYGRTGPGHKRALGHRDPSICSRNGNVRPRRNSEHVRLARTGDRDHNRNWPSAPRTDGYPRANRGSQSRNSTKSGGRHTQRRLPAPRRPRAKSRRRRENRLVLLCERPAGRRDRLPGGPMLRVRAAHIGSEMDLLVAAPAEVEPGNVACAIAAALSLGVPAQIVASRLNDLPGAPHRRSVRRGTSGVNIIDDTYNANPAGAKSALELLASAAANGRKRVVVTPGMVELGPVQARENANFAASAGEFATELLVVGHTNARSLLAGARAAGLPVVQVRNRAEAVAWTSENLGPGDAVLYENDLPDHYP